MSFYRMSSGLREVEILEKSLLLVRIRFSLMGKDTLASFAGLLRNVLVEEGFDVEDTEVKLTFVRSGYVLGWFVPSLVD